MSDLDAKCEFVPDRNRWRDPYCVMGLLDWIPKPSTECDWRQASKNPAAIDLLEANMDKSECFKCIHANPAAILTNGYDWKFIDCDYDIKCAMKRNRLSYMSLNPHPFVIDILKRDLSMIHADNLSRNSGAIKLLKIFPELIVPQMIIYNDNARDFIMKNVEKCKENKDYYASSVLADDIERDIDWSNVTLYQWSCLSQNSAMIHHLEQNLDKANISNLSENPNAMHLLKKLYVGHGNYNSRIYSNPSAFEIKTYHYGYIRADRAVMNDAIIKAVHKFVDDGDASHMINSAAISKYCGVDYNNFKVARYNYDAVRSAKAALHNELVGKTPCCA
jgi:hypothetical protein